MVSATVNPSDVLIGDKWSLIYQKIAEGSKADRLEVAVEILANIENHLRESFGKAHQDIQSIMSNHNTLPSSNVTQYNSLSRALREVAPLERDARNELEEYEHEYSRRFRTIREPMRHRGMVHDPTYG